MKITFLALLLSILYFSGLAQVSKVPCSLKSQSRLEIRLGANGRFITSSSIPEVETNVGFNPSATLTLPLKLVRNNYLFTKLILGGSYNNFGFKQIENGQVTSANAIVVSDSYTNIYAGIGLGKALLKKFKKGNFLRVPISLNVIYFPTVEVSSDNQFIPIFNQDYSSQSSVNYDDKTNFSLVPEIAIEYHFSNDRCLSWSLGIYYSRGVNIAHEGEISILRANGDIVSQSFEVPYSTFGVSFGYGIFRSKN